MIKIIDHYACPDDQYIKEVAIIQLDGKYNIPYLRKNKKDGGLFWGPLSAGVTLNGAKKYLDGIEYDSNFQKKEILQMLEASRPRNANSALQQHAAYDFKTVPLVHYAPEPQPQQMSFLDECPF